MNSLVLSLFLKLKINIEQILKKQDIDRVLGKTRSETGGLDFEILIKEGARVMLTTNISISDRLINGQMGTIFTVTIDQVNNTPLSTLNLITNLLVKS